MTADVYISAVEVITFFTFYLAFDYTYQIVIAGGFSLTGMPMSFHL